MNFMANDDQQATDVTAPSTDISNADENVSAEEEEAVEEDSVADAPPAEAVNDFSLIKQGMIIRVYELIDDPTPKDAERTRIQVFEGMVIARKHGLEIGSTITVRKVARGNIAVEKIFPLFSPVIKKIEVVKQYTVRRSKLYFLRNPRQKLSESRVIKKSA